MDTIVITGAGVVAGADFCFRATSTVANYPMEWKNVSLPTPRKKVLTQIVSYLRGSSYDKEIIFGRNQST